VVRPSDIGAALAAAEQLIIMRADRRRTMSSMSTDCGDHHPVCHIDETHGDFVGANYSWNEKAIFSDAGYICSGGAALYYDNSAGTHSRFGTRDQKSRNCLLAVVKPKYFIQCMESIALFRQGAAHQLAW